MGTPNISSLIVYTTVEICLTSFLALLVSWSSAQSKVRLRHRLILGYAIARNEIVKRTPQAIFSGTLVRGKS